MTMEAPRARLAVRGLSCRRGERVLFADLDFDLATGEIAWLRAPNGVGKTTLLRTLAGLSRPERGTVDWHGAARPLLVGHANALKDDLTVAESVAFAATLDGVLATSAAVDAAIRRLGLADGRRTSIRTLSQGQRRRVALARLCLSPPDTTWLLDEPYDALDDSATAIVDRLLVDHASCGGAVLLTSHVVPALPDLRAIVLDAL
jgi:heme exporter protein A